MEKMKKIGLRSLVRKADAGDREAMRDIFRNFLAGEYQNHPTKNFLAKLQSYAVTLAEEKDSFWILELARQFTEGEFVPADGAKAIETFELAEKAGVSFGYQGIGELYYLGKGVEQDFAKAYDYFTRHEKLSCCTQFFLGEMYRQGLFVERDDRKAMEYYRLIADSTERAKELDSYYHPACYRLANLLFTAGDTPEAVAEAFDYITIAKRKVDKLKSMEASCGFFEAKICHADVQLAYATIKEAKEKIFSHIITPEKVYQMGLKCYFGGEKKPDYRMAVSYFEKAAAGGFWQGNMMLAICAAFGYGREKDCKEARRYLEAAMAGLSAVAARESFEEATGKFFTEEFLKVEPDSEAADEFVFAGAETGFPRALLNRGDRLVRRDLGEADIKWAKEDYKKAYEGGCVRGGTLYGKLCYIGDDDEEETGLCYLKKAAIDGDVLAMELLGHVYMEGDSYLEADDAEAVYWTMKAAEGGSADAQYDLALWYDEGRRGFRHDAVAATAWYEQAVKNGNPQAMTNLGVNYLSGRGGCEMDEGRAVELFERAASEYGDARALLNLAQCHAKGWGMEKDTAGALELLAIILEDESLSEELRSEAAKLKRKIERGERG